MAQAISRFRKTLGDTQQQFAHRTGISVTSIARYETNSPPSAKILARFVKIAREADLPTFVEIFEDRLSPDEEINLQDYSVMKQLLMQMVDALPPARLRHARLALACFLTPDNDLAESEVLLHDLLVAADEKVEEAATKLIRSRDPVVERKRIRFLRTLELHDWFDFSKAYNAFRSVRHGQRSAARQDNETLLDMFVIHVDNKDGVPFDLTQDAVILDEHPISDIQDESQDRLGLGEAAEPNAFASRQPTGAESLDDSPDEDFEEES